MEGGPPCFPPGFTCPAVLRPRPREGPGGGYGALALSRPPSHARSPRRALCDSRRPARGPDGRASTPAGQRPRARKRPPVWAGPLSLAATRGVSFDFLSSGYLDVSVPPVAAGSPPQPACAGWVPPFGHPRIRGRVRLPGDYRGLPRPSSASRAKASAVRPGRPSRAAPGRFRGPRQINRIVSSLCGSQGARGEPRGPGCRGGAGRAARAAPRGVPPGASRLNEKRCVSSRSPPRGGLPRKEVIQPHVPVRLPCYDFTPLAAHTFGASAPFGFGRRLRVQETRVV